MNKKLLYILLALVMVCSVALTACNLTPAKVTITYKYNYEGAPADKTVTLDEGATITLDTPTRTDYKFDGWFTDAACTKAFTDKVANANVTLYAKWTASHTHDLHYQSSSSKHWQECSCGYTTEQVDHTFDANNTCVCGYKQGGTAHTHSWATDWSKDATNHWHVCTGCSELNDKAAHDTNGTDGACSVCGYKAQVQGQAVTVYFYTADWTTVNAYAWTDTPSFAEHLGGWPGTAINAVAGEEGWYSVEVPADTQKIIFNDGSKQTKDLLITDGPYFYKNTGYATKEEAEAAMSVPEVKTTLYYYTTAWTTVYAYTWQPEALGTWPGTQATAVEGETGWYGIEVPAETVNILFNIGDDSAKTSDLLVANGPYFVGNAGYATKEEAEAAISAPVVTTYTLKGSFDTWGAGVAFEAHTDTEVKLLNVALEANAEFKVVISVTGQNDEWINTLKDGVTVATHAANGNITVAEAGNYNLYFDITTKQLWIEKVVEEHEHVTEGTYVYDDNGHWVVCTCGEKVLESEHVPGAEATETEPQICTVCEKVLVPALGHEHVTEGEYVYDENNHWVVCDCEEKVLVGEHDTEGKEGACSVCGYTKPVEPEKVTVYYYTTTWTAVYAYAWTANEDKPLGEWPGTAINAVSGEEGWYSVEVPVDAQNIIFNNNDGAQTADLLVADGPYFYANSGYATKEEAEAAISAPVVTTYTLKGSFDTWGAGVAFEAHTDTEVKLLNVALEANAEFKVVISVTGQNDEWINTLKDGVTVATHAANGNITVAEAGNYNLYFDITTKQLWIEKVVEEHEHVTEGTYVYDDNGHWVVCTCGEKVLESEHVPGAEATETEPQICTVCEKVLVPALGHEHVTEGEYVYDENNHWVVCDCEEKVLVGGHDTNGTDGACSICGWLTPVEEEKVTVFFYNHQGWTTVHAYAWTNVEGSETVLHLGAWPGTEISAVDGEEGWYSVEVSADAQKIIFNDGSAQTADLEIKEGLVYFYNVAGYASKELAIAQYEADVKADEEAKKESRIYLDVTALTWFGSSNAVIKAYVWYTDDTNNTWPGVEMEIIDEMYSIKYDDTKTIQGIIFLRLSPDGTEWNRIELQEVSFNIETPVYVVSSNGGAIGSGTWSVLPVAAE